MSVIDMDSVVWTPRVEEEGDEWNDAHVDMPGVLCGVMTYCTKPQPGEECDKVFWFVSLDFVIDGDTEEGASRDGWAEDMVGAQQACVNAINELLAAREV